MSRVRVAGSAVRAILANVGRQLVVQGDIAVLVGANAPICTILTPPSKRESVNVTLRADTTKAESLMLGI